MKLKLLVFGKILLSFIIGVMLVRIFLLPLINEEAVKNNQIQAVVEMSGFDITDDASLGHITVENDKIKAVFHYLTIPEEYDSQGGGNLYELYDKVTDPQTQNNLISVNDGGSAGFRALGVGAGGVGNTEMYALPYQPTEIEYDAFISDNVPDARYLSHSITEIDQGWPKLVINMESRFHTVSPPFLLADDNLLILTPCLHIQHNQTS